MADSKDEAKQLSPIVMEVGLYRFPSHHGNTRTHVHTLYSILFYCTRSQASSRSRNRKMKLGKRSSKTSRNKTQKSSRSDSGSRKAKHQPSRSSNTRRRAAESSRRTTKSTTKTPIRGKATPKSNKARTKRDKTKKKTPKKNRGKATGTVDDLEITEEPIVLMDHVRFYDTSRI